MPQKVFKFDCQASCKKPSKSVQSTSQPRQQRKGHARGLKKLCALEIHRDTSVCRRYRLNLKFADRRHRRSAEDPDLNTHNINMELMKKFNWIPKMLDQVVNSNKTESNRKMTKSMNVIAREILGPVHTEKIVNHTQMKAMELRNRVFNEFQDWSTIFD